MKLFLFRFLFALNAKSQNKLWDRLRWLRNWLKTCLQQIRYKGAECLEVGKDLGSRGGGERGISKFLPYHDLNSRESDFSGFSWRPGHLLPLVGRHGKPREEEERGAWPAALRVVHRRNTALRRTCSFRLCVCKKQATLGWFFFFLILFYGCPQGTQASAKEKLEEDS